MADTRSTKPIDIWMVSFQRCQMTENAINYLFMRTRYPYRLFVVDNHSTDGSWQMIKRMEEHGRVFMGVQTSRNVGIHMAHNIGLSLVDSTLCISTDNDIYVPDLYEIDGKCWLEQMVDLMNDPENRNYAAIACQPHAFLGAKALENADNGVFEVPMCGAHMRMMRANLVREVGGWERRYDANRNHEEKTICSRLQSIKAKVGYASDIHCYHDFGDDNNWGYEDMHPHDHGHRIPGEEIWPPPEQLQIKDQLDPKTWEKR